LRIWIIPKKCCVLTTVSSGYAFRGAIRDCLGKPSYIKLVQLHKLSGADYFNVLYANENKVNIKHFQ